MSYYTFIIAELTFNNILVEISSSHGGEYEDDCLLGCCGPDVEATSTSETSVILYQITRRNIPEDSHLQ
jgi:hypothetical protein